MTCFWLEIDLILIIQSQRFYRQVARIACVGTAISFSVRLINIGLFKFNSEATRLPYITFEKMEGFRNDVQGRLLSVLNRYATRRSASLKTIGCIAYITFFAWQIIGLILFTIRAFDTSISGKHASFQQTHIEFFSYSANLELVWLLTWFLNTALVMIALSKVPSFLGYAVILRKLVRLPSFWSLVALTGVAMAGYPMILAINNHSGMEVALIVAFMVERPVQVILLAFLNRRIIHKKTPPPPPPFKYLYSSR